MKPSDMSSPVVLCPSGHDQVEIASYPVSHAVASAVVSPTVNLIGFANSTNGASSVCRALAFVPCAVHDWAIGCGSGARRAIAMYHALEYAPSAFHDQRTSMVSCAVGDVQIVALAPESDSSVVLKCHPHCDCCGICRHICICHTGTMAHMGYGPQHCMRCVEDHWLHLHSILQAQPFHRRTRFGRR